MVVAFVCGERVQQCALGFRVTFFPYSRSIEERRDLLLIVPGLAYFPAVVNTIGSVGVLFYLYSPRLREGGTKEEGISDSISC